MWFESLRDFKLNAGAMDSYVVGGVLNVGATVKPFTLIECPFLTNPFK